MPRLVRRQPLAERIKAYLDPLDFLLWLSEQFDSEDWDQWQKDWAKPIGLGLNLVMLIARANSGGRRRVIDDVFGDEPSGSGWLSWFCAFLVHFLTLVSFLNAAYTFYRTRPYRLFERPVDEIPSTPSARRVRVDSSPASMSPRRIIANLIASQSAEARAHPDSSRDVWEVSVWDPTPLSLTTFCFFSPGHILVYWLFLPTVPLDPRPSTTVATTLFLITLLTVQLTMFQSSFLQQAKDTSVINKEVLNEYDIKYVHPRTQPLMRDVGTQFSGPITPHNHKRRSGGLEHPLNSVDTYQPTVIINKGFRPNPNPSYVEHIDRDGSLQRQTPPRNLSNGTVPTFQTPAHLRDASSPMQPRTTVKYSQARPNVGLGTGDGGSLGVYSHANSPLKKATSMNFQNAHQRERSLSPVKREGSPLKRTSTPDGMNKMAAAQRWAHLQATSARRESGRF